MQDRIKQLRKSLRLNQTEFGERIGVKQGSVAGYEKGARVPLDAVINSICREFNVNEDWLRTGEGEMYIKKLPTDEVAEYVAELLDNDSRNAFYDVMIDMLKTYCELDEKSKTVVKDFFAKLRENMQKKEGD